jgi:hypothetical protein
MSTLSVSTKFNPFWLVKDVPLLIIGIYAESGPKAFVEAGTKTYKATCPYVEGLP